MRSKGSLIDSADYLRLNRMTSLKAIEKSLKKIKIPLEMKDSELRKEIFSYK